MNLLQILPRYTDLSIAPRESGIYFLFGENDRLLYIGKSTKLKYRLQNHIDPQQHPFMANFRDFQITFHMPKHLIKSFVFLKIDKSEIKHVEKALIMLFRPAYNIGYNEEFYLPEWQMCKFCYFWIPIKRIADHFKEFHGL